jgi:phosphoribosylformimino-5-aminoimidazole carboxamide ribotide isomerase
LEALAHRVEFSGRANVAQKCSHRLRVAKSGESFYELVESLGRLDTRLGWNYFSTGHVNMLTCYYAAMQIIPAIDLLGDYAVRLEQGDYERVLFRQPIEEFMGRIVATEPSLIHIVDLEGARDGELRRDVVRRCVSLAGSIPVQVSGGIRSIESAREALDAGAARVIVGTAVWSTPEALADYVEALGEKLLVAFDVRDGLLAVRGWLASTGLSVDDALEQCIGAGVQRLHVTAIDRDGTMRGPDLDLYEKMCRSVLAIVAAGGVRDDADVLALEHVGCEAAVMGLGYLSRLGLSLGS